MLAPNTTLQNRYRIVRKLGQGGMGAIYEAVDERVNCLVALKETLVGANPSLRDAFRREAELLANLRHPLLPKVMDYFGEGDGEFLVMEFIAGNDLLELLELRGGPLPQVQVLSWAVELLKLLEYLHTHEPSILHRDIKPANIKKTSQGEIFLLDFGLAKGATGQMLTVSTESSVPGYTPIYSPLEQIIGQGTDQRSDLYSLGAALYHLLTGQAPISAPARFNAIENNQPDPLKPVNQLNLEVAPEVAACIQKAMALSRRDRIETAQAMRAQLEEAIRLIIDREVARKAEQHLLDTSPDRDLSKPLIVDEGVQFTVYAPEKIKPEKNYSLLAFAHLAKRRADAAPDEPDPLEEVKNQAARVLGEQREDYRDTKDSSSQPVPRGGQLTFVPVVKGLTFNPPSRSFTWEKSVHREEFDVRASSEVDGQLLTGTITVFLGSVVIADVGLTISVDSDATPTNEKISLDHGRSARRMKQVFAAYSHDDEQVVAELAQVAPLFGSRFLLDRTHLEPGEDRVEGLQRLIRDADVFQLFWSTNSMRSPQIGDEIKYAAGLNRPGFILPTYWEEPVPRSPSEGLPPPEVDRLQFYRIYPGAISQSLQPKSAESRLVILGPPRAEIYIDDERQGSIGTSGRIILKSISAGKHVLRVTCLGERDDERVIDVRADGGEQVFQTFVKEAITLGSASAEDLRTAAEPASGASTKELPSPNFNAPTGALAAPAQTTVAAPAPFGSSVEYQGTVTVSCRSCGTEYSADMKFCARCGAALYRSDTVSAPLQVPTFQPPSAASYQAPPAPKQKARWMIPVFAGAAMVLFLAVITPVFFMMNGTRSPSIATNRETAANRNTGTANVNSTANTNSDFQVAPNLHFVSLDGQKHGLSDFRGRVVVLNFWDASTETSRAQVPVLNELQKKYGGLGLTVLGVTRANVAVRVREFQKETPQDYLVGLTDGEYEAHLPASSFPTTYIIDRRGQVRKKMVGVQTRSAFESVVEPLIKERPAQ